MVVNPDMTTWDTIGCEFDHGGHATKLVHVDLPEVNGFADLPAVPPALAVEFDMYVYDWEKYQSCRGAYCPAHDAVSETIDTLGIWEPVETILTLDVFNEPNIGGFIDFGAQIGWFSVLARECGRETIAVEADAANAQMLRANIPEAQLLEGRIGTVPGIVTWATAPFRDIATKDGYPARLAKIDVEGAEPDVITLIEPLLNNGMIDHLLVECSPTFHDGYPAMVRQIIDAGYAAFLLPDKQPTPDDFTGWRDLDYRIDDWADVEDFVASWHQENVWFTRKDLL